jgi:hypothetical protein
MKWQVCFGLFVFPLFLFAETISAKSSIPHANLTCIKITPAVESGKLSRDTVIETTLNYFIDLPKLEADGYSITVLFGSIEGQNYLFNKKQTRLGDAHLYLKKTSGTIKFKYPMDAVWTDNRLKRPISLIFYLLEHDRNGTNQAIASAGPFVFRSTF